MPSLRRLGLAVASALLSPAVFLPFPRPKRSARSGCTKSEGECILVLSQVLWDDVWQRPQEFAWNASRNSPVIFCAPVQVHNWAATLRRRWKRVRQFDNGRQLTILSPLVLSGHFRNEQVFRQNCRRVARQLRPWLAQYKSVRVVLNSPFVWPGEGEVRSLFGELHRLKAVAYDVIDDFTAFEWSPPYGKPLDAELMRDADLIFTGTHRLLEERKPLRPDAQFIACGVDYSHFANPATEPPELANLPRPIIGYFGTVSERVDLKLLDTLAHAFPTATLLVIGPLHYPQDQLPRGAGNIRYLGLRPHQQLPAFAQRFSVGLIPFRLTEATLKLNPVKTLEYLAAGVPVVSTAIPDVVRFFSDVVHVARDQDEFIEMVRKALTYPDDTRSEKGRAMAREASWEVMTRTMEERLKSITHSQLAQRNALTHGSSSGSGHEAVS